MVSRRTAGPLRGTVTRRPSSSRSAHEHDGVLLEVVADAGDVAGDLDLRGQAHAGDLAQGRVRLLGRHRVDAGADATTLRRPLQGRALGLRLAGLAAVAHQLLDRGHGLPVCTLDLSPDRWLSPSE